MIPSLQVLDFVDKEGNEVLSEQEVESEDEDFEVGQEDEEEEDDHEISDEDADDFRTKGKRSNA